jgi:hypothetical protein
VPRPPHTHTHTHVCRQIRLPVLSIVTMGLISAANSQTPRYRVVDLGEVNTASDTDLYGTMGINNYGEVVFTSGDPTLHAWVWLPSSHYGFSAGFHTLDNSEYTSVARDINENGIITGVSGGAIHTTNAHATIWTLSSNTITSTVLSDDSSQAFGLNNSSPPVVAGEHLAAGDCDPFTVDTIRGMYWVPGTGTTNLPPHTPYTGQSSTAFDIRRNGSKVAVGHSANCDANAPECPGELVGTSWDTSTNHDALPLGSIQSGAAYRHTYGYGINDDARVAGWIHFEPSTSKENDEPIQCFQIALYWETPTSTPVDLSQYLPNVGDHSRAYAINSLSLPQVVGVDTQPGHAILWESFSSGGGLGWTSTDLNNEIADCDSIWSLKKALDINDNGWIVCLGIRSSHFHAALLIPMDTDCPVDTNSDGCVNIDDLLTVIAQFDTPCPVGIICTGDTDLNCKVDMDDINNLVTHWSTASPCVSPCGGSMMMTTSSGGGGAVPMLEIIAAIANSNLPASVQAEIIDHLLSM